MKKGKLAIFGLSLLAAGFFSGCATSPVGECLATDTDIEPVAEYSAPVRIVREMPASEAVIERSTIVSSPQRCF